MFINIVVPVLVVAFGAMFSHQGWLDEAIKNEKEKFLNEFVSFVPITNVTLMKAPPGFKDSPGWDEESVIRLLMLLEISNARPVRKALSHALGPSRRFLSGNKTEELFPSWGRDHPNYFYYDDMVQKDGNITDYHQDEVVTDDTVLCVSNPVESRLPGPMLTVKLLRLIMEKRAEGLRKMPKTTRRPRYTRTPMKKDSANGTDKNTSLTNSTDTTSGTNGGKQDSKRQKPPADSLKQPKANESHEQVNKDDRHKLEDKPSQQNRNHTLKPHEKQNQQNKNYTRKPRKSRKPIISSSEQEHGVDDP